MENTQWRRATEIPELHDYDGKLTLFHEDEEELRAPDTHAGSLGDCHFLAALGGLVENPERIKKIFVSKQTNPQDLYSVKLVHHGI